MHPGTQELDATGLGVGGVPDGDHEEPATRVQDLHGHRLALSRPRQEPEIIKRWRSPTPQVHTRRHRPRPTQVQEQAKNRGPDRVLGDRHPATSMRPARIARRERQSLRYRNGMRRWARANSHDREGFSRACVGKTLRDHVCLGRAVRCARHPGGRIFPMRPLALFDLDDTLVDRRRAFTAWAQEFVAEHRLDGEALTFLHATDARHRGPMDGFFATVCRTFDPPSRPSSCGACTATDARAGVLSPRGPRRVAAAAPGRMADRDRDQVGNGGQPTREDP